MSIARVLFPMAIIALGVALIALARWSRKRSSALHHAEARNYKANLARLFLRPYSIESSEDLYHGSLPEGWELIGRVLTYLAIIVALAFVIIAAYAILA